MAQELTIVSVYHNELSKRLLELNGEFTRALNPEADIVWLVGDNTPQSFANKIDGNKFTVIQNPEDYHGLGSQQHAGAINKCLKQVNTRFVLSLDSDFYIVRKGWIEAVIEYMKANNLAFFGATYHASSYAKYRYFPSVVCMVVDLERVPLETLDFSPQMEFKETGEPIRTEKDRDTKKKTVRKKIKRFLPVSIVSFIGRILRTLSIRQRRLIIGVAQDTSYKISARYANDFTFRREFAATVFDPTRDPYLNGRLHLALNRIIETLLPDHLCYVPKDRVSYSSTGFKERGFADLRGFGWEEYVWQDKPFGTHIRGSKTWKRNESEDDEMKSIQKALETFIKKEG